MSVTENISEALAYGRHAPLGLTLDIPEEKDPPKDYKAKRSLGDKGACPMQPSNWPADDGCSYRCEFCGFHACMCWGNGEKR